MASSTMESNYHRLIQASLFAICKHQSQQRKNLKAEPYVTHPLRVADLLIRIAHVTDIDVLVAAILHDTVEDTDTTIEEIREQFGLRAAGIVAEVTDDTTLSREERRRLQETSMATKSHGARLIKLADKLHNLSELITDPPTKWSQEQIEEYLEFARRVTEAGKGTNEDLERALWKLLTASR